MHIFNLSIRRILLSLCIIAITSLASHADIDKKYFAKMADKIWSMDLPGFDINANLSDSIFQGQSAVYIARYIGIDADYDVDPDPNKKHALNISNRNATNALEIRRSMVKINDASAAEYFTEFTIDPESEFSIDTHNQTIYQGPLLQPAKTKHSFDRYTLYSTKEAFGARIHKPDGSVSDVDLSEILTQTAGKNDKDVKYKIAIPNLQPGDILEYFYTTEYDFDETPLPEIPISFLASYPTRMLTIDIRVDPKLNMEYGSYNGAPRISQFAKTDNGKNLLFLQLENLLSLDEKLPYFSLARQMPLMEVYILNNEARLSYVPKMSRPGGMRLSNPAFVMRDIGFAINDSKPASKYVGSAHSIIKNWMKLNPEASPSDLADAAWVALRYVVATGKEDVSELEFVRSFYELMHKLDSFTDARIGVANSRKSVDITQIAYFKDASYFIKNGDRFYMAPANPLVLGGQIPASFDGENYVVYTARPDNPNLYMSVDYGRLPQAKAIDNTVKSISTLTIDPEAPDSISVNTRVTLTGSQKQLINPLLTSETFIKDMQSFLGAKPQKISNDIDTKAEEDDARESMEDLAKGMWDTDASRVVDYTVVQSGFVPSKPESIIEVNGIVPDVINQAGNNLMVNIGKFIWRQSEIIGSQRNRDVSVIKNNPNRDERTVILTIPDGYELVEESIADLNQSVNTQAGSFNAEASFDGDKTVKIRVLERYPRSILPPELWPEMLKVLDAAHAFNSATLLLRPKK